MDAADLRAGQRVLIHAAAGGVGTCGDHALRSLRTMRPGGVLLTITGEPDEDVRQAAVDAGVWAVWMMAEPDHLGLEKLAELVARGALRVEVAQVLPLVQAAEAHRISAASSSSP